MGYFLTLNEQNRAGLGETAFLSWKGPGDHALKIFDLDQVIMYSIVHEIVHCES